MMVSRRPNRAIRASVLSIYRRLIRLIMKFPEQKHQKIWYDYTRLKFQEQEQADVKSIPKLVDGADEQIDWVQSIISRKKTG